MNTSPRLCSPARCEPARRRALETGDRRDPTGHELLQDSPTIKNSHEGIQLPGVLPMLVREFDVPTPGLICEAASQAMFAGQTFRSDNCCTLRNNLSERVLEGVRSL